MPYLLHHLLESSALDRPNGIAVVDGERSLTYRELDARADQLAHLLSTEGVNGGDLVGIYVEKSLEAIVGIYAVLKRGAAYVPLDPQSPVARLAYISANCGLRCLLTSWDKERAWPDIILGGAPIDLIVPVRGRRPEGTAASAPSQAKVVDGTSLEPRPGGPPPSDTIDLDLAYVLYTSGSTGEPKGVMLSHLNGLNFVRWGAQRFAVTAEDRLSGHAPLHFDLSIFDIFVAAAAGATLVLVPPAVSVLPTEVARFIDRHAISVWYSVPSILSVLTLRGGLTTGALPSLRAVLFAGEVFPTKYLRQLMSLLPHAEFHNLYGPTETNVCTHYQVPPLPEDSVQPIPIGQAIANVHTFVVRPDGCRAEPGEVGELYVRGGTVMGGYWGDEAKTSRNLVPNPFGPALDRVYRTGDLVQADDNGDYRFLGRRDAQIKSRGYRIELGEIETAIYANPDVVECAVVAVPDEMITNRIRAFVSVRSERSTTELLRFCQERIPKYMVPESFEFMENLPKTSTGKIDRQALMKFIEEGERQS